MTDCKERSFIYTSRQWWSENYDASVVDIVEPYMILYSGAALTADSEVFMSFARTLNKSTIGICL